ncbi:MAG: hypothetical protein ABI834_11400 [Ginsengibacter sp.]
MQHVDNDMDELFQRAAENYPLRVDNGDWESIAQKIADTSNASIAVAPAGKGNKKVIALAALLFLFLGLYIFQKFATNTTHENNSNEIAKGVNNASVKAGIKNNTLDIHSEEEKNSHSQASAENNNYKKRLMITVTNKTKVITGIPNSFSYNIQTPDEEKHENNVVIEKPDNYYKYFFSENNFREEQNKKLSEKFKNNPGVISNEIKSYIPELKDVSTADNNFINTKKEKPGAPNKKKGLYFGLIAGPDFSRVKSKPFNTGFDLGLTIGYKANSKLSFETGIIRNRKNYSSDGSNFNMGKIRSTMPAGMTIKDLVSQSTLIEIPLKVKYDIISKKNSGFFVTGGISLYIMTKENNMYNVSLNGNQGKFEGVYHKNNYRFPADATLSVGYQHAISSYLDFRVEPFLKIPLQGIGVGSLPVTSVGLQVGITRRIK